MSITIDLPKHLNHTFWEEYCDLDWGVDGRFKGFRDYISHRIPDAIVDGHIREGYTLTFDTEEDYTCFKLRWR